MMAQKFGRRAEWKTDRSYALFNLYGQTRIIFCQAKIFFCATTLLSMMRLPAYRHISGFDAFEFA
jgi:hypothetical protein